MKNIFKLSFLVVLGVGILASCTKKSNTPPAFVSSMSTTLNGMAWTASTITSAVNSGTLTITGTSSNTSQMIISLPATVTPGTYSLGGTYNVVYNLNSSDTYFISFASIDVISNDGSLITGTFRGTFNDNNHNSIDCTNGAFNVKYQ